MSAVWTYCSPQCTNNDIVPPSSFSGHGARRQRAEQIWKMENQSPAASGQCRGACTVHPGTGITPSALSCSPYSSLSLVSSSPKHSLTNNTKQHKTKQPWQYVPNLCPCVLALHSEQPHHRDVIWREKSVSSGSVLNGQRTTPLHPQGGTFLTTRMSTLLQHRESEY